MTDRKSKIYLNYAGLGFINAKAYLALRNFLEEYYSPGPPVVIEKYRQYISRLRKELSVLLNCGSEEIIYTKNTTEGIIIASEALPLQKGDEILLLDNEYGANKFPWLKKQKDGMRVKIIKASSPENAFSVLINRISQKTNVVAISLVQYLDGYQCDVELLSKICRRNGAYLVIDGIQAVGTRAVDLKKTSVDILVCGGHKHLNSIVGTGFMYVNKKIIKNLQDTKVGIRSIKSMDNNGYILKEDAGRFEDGTPNLFGILSLYLSVKSINQIGIKRIEKKNLFLLKSLKTLLKKNEIPFINYREQGNIVALKVNNPEEWCDFLRKNNIYIKCFKNTARVSFSYASTPKEFKLLVKKTREWLDKATPFKVASSQSMR